jgi:hypothetical protein
MPAPCGPRPFLKTAPAPIDRPGSLAESNGWEPQLAHLSEAFCAGTWDFRWIRADFVCHAIVADRPGKPRPVPTPVMPIDEMGPADRSPPRCHSIGQAQASAYPSDADRSDGPGRSLTITLTFDRLRVASAKATRSGPIAAPIRFVQVGLADPRSARSRSQTWANRSGSPIGAMRQPRQTYAQSFALSCGHSGRRTHRASRCNEAAIPPSP